MAHKKRQLRFSSFQRVAAHLWTWSGPLTIRDMLQVQVGRWMKNYKPGSALMRQKRCDLISTYTPKREESKIINWGLWPALGRSKSPWDDLQLVAMIIADNNLHVCERPSPWRNVNDDDETVKISYWCARPVPPIALIPLDKSPLFRRQWNLFVSSSSSSYWRRDGIKIRKERNLNWRRMKNTCFVFDGLVILYNLSAVQLSVCV